MVANLIDNIILLAQIAGHDVRPHKLLGHGALIKTKQHTIFIANSENRLKANVTFTPDRRPLGPYGSYYSEEDRINALQKIIEVI